MKASHAAFVAAMALNKSNIKEAAAAAGIDYEYARQLLVRHPELREAIEAMQLQTIGSTLRDWSDLHAKAQLKLESLMGCGDLKVEFWAVKEALDRCEGKPRQKVDVKVEVPEDSSDTPSMRLAIALVFAGKYASLVQALEFVEKNPDVLHQWEDSQRA